MRTNFPFIPLCRLYYRSSLDVSRPEWKELIIKYGPPELYEKLERISKGRQS